MSVSLEDLKQHVKVSDEQLDQQCSDEHIREIALNMPSWELYAPYLGLTTVEVDGIADDARRYEQRTLKTLEKWKTKLVFKATYRSFINVCLKLKNADLAEKVCRYAKGVCVCV